MTLAEKIQQKLVEAPPKTGRHELSLAAEGSGWSLQLTLDRRDELGCLVWELALHRTVAAPAKETLPSWAERVVRQATGLLEPLKVIEIDEHRNEGLLRSDKPTERQSRVSYYEMLLQGTRTATVRRFQASADGTGKRLQIAFALTHDGLAKLADDVTR
jgi:hypothetical protein